jgi:hypothetical protein
MKTIPLSPKEALSARRCPHFSLAHLWREFCHFMQDKSVSIPPAEVSSYDKKVRLYPYLPAIEEQRDWLNRIGDRP